MQYWAHINGTQYGPVEKEQLIGLGLTPESYVWYNGLEDWTQAKDVADLADLFPAKAETVAETTTATEPEKATTETEKTDTESETTTSETVESDTEEETTTSETSESDTEDVKTEETTVSEENKETDGQLPPPLPYQPATAPYYVPQQQPYQPQQPQQEEEVEPCPPTNLIWAILTTLFCCQIFGIISIIYAAQVTTKYHQGDIMAAKKYSDRAAGWSIASIVFGLMYMPFAIAFQLMA